jgi:hypothetical protein
MKHRLTLLVFMLAICSVILPGVAAQDSDSGWDLTQELKFTDLGLHAMFPTDWVTKASEATGVYIAESEDDLSLAADDDPATIPTGTVINIVALPMTGLVDFVGEDAKLDQYVDFIVIAFNGTEKDKRLEAPIVGHRSLTTFAEDDNGHGLIITTWTQGESLVSAVLTTPDTDTAVRNLASWVGFLKGITPLGALPLSKTPIELKTAEAQVYVPDGWFHKEDSYLAYEVEADAGSESKEGSMIFAGEEALSDLSLKDDATLEEAVAAIATVTGVTITHQEEFILLGQPAIMYTGTDSTGSSVIATQAIVNGTTVQIAVVAPSEEKLKEVTPTYLAVVQSLAKVKTE